MIHQLSGDHEATQVVHDENDVSRLTLEGWRIVAVLEQTHVEEGRRTVPKPVSEEQSNQGYNDHNYGLYELTEPVLVTTHAYVLAKSKDDTILTLAAEKQGVEAANQMLQGQIQELESAAHEVLEVVNKHGADHAVWVGERKKFLDHTGQLSEQIAKLKKLDDTSAKETKAFKKALSSRDAQIAKCWAEFGGSRMRGLLGEDAESPVPEPPGPTRHQVLADDEFSSLTD